VIGWEKGRAGVGEQWWMRHQLGQCVERLLWAGEETIFGFTWASDVAWCRWIILGFRSGLCARLRTEISTWDRGDGETAGCTLRLYFHAEITFVSTSSGDTYHSDDSSYFSGRGRTGQYVLAIVSNTSIKLIGATIRAQSLSISAVKHPQPLNQHEYCFVSCPRVPSATV
jgi:hypothetical protein